MNAAVPSHLTAVVALVTASVVAVTPVVPAPPQIRIASPDVQLTDAEDSLLNIPVNLLEDIANIPYVEVQNLNELAESLFFSASWIVGNSTNIWGADPGDPTHFEVFTQLLLPFPALSVPLGQDLAILDEAELPVTAACAAAACDPVVPVESITGITFIDKILWSGAILGGYPFPLLDELFKVPLTGPDSLSTGYTFGDVSDPAGPAFSGFGFEGTVGPDNLLPWADTTVQFNNPLQEFWDSLVAAPTGIELTNGSDLYDAVMAYLAGLVIDFDPFIPGSPVCPGTCDLPSDLTYPALVQDIYSLDPGNALIKEWLDGYAAGTVNGSTPEQIAYAEQYLQTGLFDFNPDTVAQIENFLASINPDLPAVVNDAGLLVAGGNPSALVVDIAQLLGVGTEYTDLTNFFTQLSTEIGTDIQSALQELTTLIQQGIGPGVDALTLLLGLGTGLPADLLTSF